MRVLEKSVVFIVDLKKDRSDANILRVFSIPVKDIYGIIFT